MKKLFTTVVILLSVLAMNAQGLYWGKSSGTYTWNTTASNKIWSPNSAGPFTSNPWVASDSAYFVTPAGGTITLGASQTTKAINVLVTGDTIALGSSSYGITTATNINLGANVNLYLNPGASTLTYTATSGGIQQSSASNGSNLILTDNQASSYGELAIATGGTISAPLTITNGGAAVFGIATSGTGTSTISGPVTLNQLTGAGNIFLIAASAATNYLKITGTITGTGNIDVSSGPSGGKGCLWLAPATSTANSFVGDIYMNATSGSGSLRAGSGAPNYYSGLPTSSPYSSIFYSTSTYGGSFDLYGSNTTINKLSQTVASIGATATTGGITNNGAQAATLTVTQNTSTSFGAIGTGTQASAIIADGSSKTALTMASANGSGILTLNGNNTYTGATTVNSGSLFIDNTSGTGLASGTTVAVNNGGTFGGNGSAAGTINVNNGGAIAPGASGNGSQGTFTTGPVNFAASSIYNVDINALSGTAGTSSTWDLLASTGAVTLPASGSVTLNITGGSGVSGFLNLSGYSWKILTSTSLTNFSSSAFTLNISGFPSYTGVFSLTNPTAGEIDLVYTPPVAAFTINPTNLTAFSTVAGTASTPAQPFTLAGNNLDGSSITITPTAGYEISITNATSGFQGSGNAITLTSGSGNYAAPTLSTTTVWVRIASTATAGVLNGSITIAGGNVSSPGTVTLSGNVFDLQPTVQASNISFSNVTTSGFTVNWSDGNGANQAVVISTTTITAPANGNDYATVNSNYSTALTYGTTNHVVAAGAISGATGVNVTGLTPGVTYNVEVFDYNGSGGSNNYNISTATLNPNSQATPLPTYYWNGASPAQTVSPSGGTGTWNGTITNWLTASSGGSIAAWPNTTGYSANFGSTAGIVTVGASVKAGSALFNTTGYTLASAANTDTLRAPITLGAGVTLNLAPNASNVFNYFGNISGGSSLEMLGSTLTGSNYVRFNMNQNNSSISTPLTVTLNGSTTSSNFVGIVATGTGVSITGPVTLASTVGGGRIELCATSGNSMNISGQISGTGDIQFSAGPQGGAGVLTLSNTANNFAGNVYMVGSTSGKFQASAGAGSCVPSTFGVYYPGYTSGSPGGGVFDLNGSDITISALSQTGTSATTVGSISNSASGTGTNTLTINQSATTNFNLPITDGATAHTAVKFTGSGTLTLGAVNTFTGGLILNNGVVQMGASGNIFVNTMPITFNGGQFSTGATSGFSETVGALNLTASSSINLGSGSHTLKFANSSSYASTWAGTLTIYNWQGTASDTGTAGRVFVGIDNSGLTTGQLSQITFAGYAPGATILGNGEIVPTTEALSVNTTGFTANFGNINIGSASAPQSFIVYGSGLSSSVVLTPPTGFQISLSPGSGYTTSSITLPISGGSLANTTIYVEFVPVAPGAASGNITAVSGIYEKTVSVSGTGVLTAVYSQGSGKAATSAIWAVTPVGTPQTITALGGFDSTLNVIIQNGHTVTTSTSQEITAKDLTVEAGGVLKELTSSSTGPYYINLYGNLTVNGQLGGLNGTDSLGINANGTNHTITGAGTINLQRIRNNNASRNVTDVTIDADMNLWWIGSSLYNNVAGSTFNVTVNAGKTVNFEGQSDISVNGIAGATANRGGIYTINGTLIGLDTVYAFASATASSASGIVIGSGGLMSANFVKVGIGGTGNFSFNVNAGGELDVNKVLQLQTGTFAPLGTVLMKSTSATQIAIIDNFSVGTFNGTYSGNITAQRYLLASTTYTQQHEMSSPVNGPSMSQFGSTSPSGGYVTPQPDCDEQLLNLGSLYGTVFAHNENAPNAHTCAMAEWYVEPSTDTATNARGYSVLKAGPTTISVTGQPNLNANYTRSNLTNSGWSNTTMQGHNLKSGWHLMGNPYLAPLNLTATNSGFDNQVLVWNAEGPYAGSFVSYTVGSNAVIAPFQAFMVHMTNTGTNGSYTINANERVIASPTFYMQNDNQLDIVATNLNTGLLDKTTVAFNSNATDNFDPQYDANKTAGSLNRHTLYTTIANGDWMSINVLNSVATTSAVPMGFEPGANGNYSFNFGNLNTFDPTTYIYLEDLQQHVMYNVRNGDYMFSADSADNWNRFVLHFTPAAVIAATDADCHRSGAITVTQPGAANWNYTLVNSNNVVVSSGILNQANPLNISAATGTYTLTLVDNNNYTVTKQIQVNGAEAITAAFTASGNVVNTQTEVNFVNNSVDANTFNWNFGDGSTSSLVSPVHTYAAAGTYVVELNASNITGCISSTTQTIKVVNSTTGITSVDNNGISMWSNNDKIYIDFSQLTKVGAQIKIYDVLGQLLVNDEFNSNDLYVREMDNTTAACVIVSIRNEGQTTTKKLFLINSK